MFTGIKAVIGVGFIALLIGGWAYGHSGEFRLRCAFQKAGAENLSFPQNLVCATMFDIDSNG